MVPQKVVFVISFTEKKSFWYFEKYEFLGGSELCTLRYKSFRDFLTLSNVSFFDIIGLDGLPIRELDLSYNYIRKIENLHSLQCLHYINLGYNSIRSLRGLQNHPLLEDINLR